MNTKRITLLSLFFILPIFASIGQAAVLRAVTVETEDAAAYAQQIALGAEIMRISGSPGTIRVWQGVYAGDNAGSVVVTVEYPTLSALAADREALAQNEAFSEWLADLAEIRTILSDSVYEEITVTP